MNPLEQQDWGLTHYSDAFERQKILVNQRVSNETPDTLVFTEHKPVFTIGVRNSANTNLLWDEKFLKKQGIELAKTNRGGDITYHGPGQIVGYPIISLHSKKDLHDYLRRLEQVLINALNWHELTTSRNPGRTGIWLIDKKENRKIAAIGIAVKQWITYHGFALNVNTDLSHFKGIIPCGISSEEGTVTSMEKELGMELDLEAIKHTIFLEFHSLFYNA